METANQPGSGSEAYHGMVEADMNSHGVIIEISDVDSDISWRYSNTLASFPLSLWER